MLGHYNVKQIKKPDLFHVFLPISYKWFNILNIIVILRHYNRRQMTVSALIYIVFSVELCNGFNITL